jgi:hypothetical protein
VALSYRVARCMRVYLGYDFLYWSAVGRPGDFIDRQIDARQIPTSATFATGVQYNGPAPITSLNRRDFTAHGIFFGVEFGW